METKRQMPAVVDDRLSRTPMACLMRLMQMRLPTNVVDPQELRLISLLKATELIEAEIHTARSAKAGHWQSRAATVTRITEDGFAELTRVGLDLLRSAGRAVGKRAGPLEYLASIADSSFPRRVENPVVVANVSLLKATGLVDATITAGSEGSSDSPRHALILRITARGRDLLARHG